MEARTMSEREKLLATMSLRQDVYTRLGDVQKAIVPKLIHRADGHCVWDAPLPLGAVRDRIRGIADHIDAHLKPTPSSQPQPSDRSPADAQPDDSPTPID